MIEATYRALAPTQIQERLQLKMQELEVQQANFMTVNTTAALIGGFAFTGVTSIGWDNSASMWMKIGFYVSSVMCIALCMHCVIISTAAMVMAPDLAMRGGNPETNIVRALDGVLSVRRHVYWSYGLATVLFQVTMACISIYTMMVGEGRGWHSPVYSAGAGATMLILLLSLISSSQVGLHMKRRLSKSDPIYAQDGQMPRSKQPMSTAFQGVRAGEHAGAGLDSGRVTSPRKAMR